MYLTLFYMGNFIYLSSRFHLFMNSCTLCICVCVCVRLLHILVLQQRHHLQHHYHRVNCVWNRPTDNVQGVCIQWLLLHPVPWQPFKIQQRQQMQMQIATTTTMQMVKMLAVAVEVALAVLLVAQHLPQQILVVPPTPAHHIHKPIIPKCHATHPKRAAIRLIAK